MSIASCSIYSSGDTSLPSFKVHSRKSDSQRSLSSDKEPIQVSVTRLLVPEYQEELRKERQVGVGNVDPTRPAPIIVTIPETLVLLQEAAGKLSHGLVEVVDSKGKVSVLDKKVFNSSKKDIANKNLGIIKKQPWKDRFIAGNICGFLATGLGVAGIVVKDTVDFPVLTCFSGSESLSFGRFGFVQAIFYNSFIAASTLSVEIIAGLLLFSLSAENSQEVDRPQSKFGCLGRLWNSILRGSTQSGLEQYSGGEFKVSLGCGAIGFSRRLAPSPLLQLIGEIDGADDY